MNTNLPVIAGIKIQQNNNGLFNLNDLHKASGGLNRHRPSFWLETVQARDYIELLQLKEKSDVISINKGGANPGVFAHENLVYSYAMWISSGFHHQVIETFKAVLRGDFDSALTEAQKAQIAFYEDAKRNESIPADTCDFQIACIRGDNETASAIFDNWSKEGEWRRNDPVGIITDTMEKITGPGFEENISVPHQLGNEKTVKLIKKLAKKQGLKLDIEFIDVQLIRIESLY